MHVCLGSCFANSRWLQPCVLSGCRLRSAALWPFCLWELGPYGFEAPCSVPRALPPARCPLNGSSGAQRLWGIRHSHQCCFCKMSHPELSLGPCTQCYHSSHTLLKPLKPLEWVLGGCPVCCKTACCLIILLLIILIILPPDTMVSGQLPAIACRRAGGSFWEFSTYQNKVPLLGPAVAAGL